MAEQEQKPNLIEEYLRRLAIQKKSASLNEYAERLAHLSALRELLTNLNAAGYASSEGAALLGASESTSLAPKWGPPDFVVLRDDVLIYLYLAIGPVGELTGAYLQGVWKDLRDNPALSGVAICWPDKDYSCVVIDSFAIRSYLERPTPVQVTREELVPLLGAIDTFFRAQLVDWNLSPSELQFSSRNRLHELGSDLREHLLKILLEEKLRIYEIPEKITALSRISSNDVEVLVERITGMIAKHDTSTQALQELQDLIEMLSKR